MELSDFIKSKRQISRILDTLTMIQRNKIATYIETLEDEIVKLSRKPQKLIKQPQNELKTHITDNWKFPKPILELNMLAFFKKHKYKIPFKHLEYNKEYNKTPFQKKLKSVEDIKWLEENYPVIYEQQIKLAYLRENEINHRAK